MLSCGRKCLPLTHVGTLFSGFEPDVRAAGPHGTRDAVAALISRELKRQNLPAATFGTPGQEELTIAATADRGVPGRVNDMAFPCGHRRRMRDSNS